MKRTASLVSCRSVHLIVCVFHRKTGLSVAHKAHALHEALQDEVAPRVPPGQAVRMRVRDHVPCMHGKASAVCVLSACVSSYVST